MTSVESVTYWDASAILSTLFRDSHSDQAMEHLANKRVVHVVSSLAWTETHAVIGRVERERALATTLVDAACEALTAGPWRYSTVVPDAEIVAKLARKWPLRGADLWHLAAAKTLKRELPSLAVLSFDSRLAAAASAESL
jgi:predicted nucleic acid-binding protein